MPCLLPKGPQGQKRPADAIGAAVIIAKIATARLTRLQPPQATPPRWGGRAARRGL